MWPATEKLSPLILLFMLGQPPDPPDPPAAESGTPPVSLAARVQRLLEAQTALPGGETVGDAHCIGAFPADGPGSNGERIAGLLSCRGAGEHWAGALGYELSGAARAERPAIFPGTPVMVVVADPDTAALLSAGRPALGVPVQALASGPDDARGPGTTLPRTLLLVTARERRAAASQLRVDLTPFSYPHEDDTALAAVPAAAARLGARRVPAAPAP